MKNHERRRTWLPIIITAPLVLLTIVLYASWNTTRLWTVHDELSDQPKEQYQLDPALHKLRDPTTLTYEWRVTQEERRPDGVLKNVYLVNNQFPGPTIEARSGDRLVIKVENALTEGMAIHWHGLHMKGANAMDGAAGITQDLIATNETFVYDFVVDQPGTFWYHAHSAVQRADGLYGGLVVHEPNQDIETEYLLMISDWYHKQADDVLAKYATADSFGMEPVPDSILINGRGSYNCSLAVPARPVDCKAQHFEALRMTSYSKIRIVNVGAYAGFTIRISNSILEVGAVDGGNEVISPASESIGVLEPGERIDVDAEILGDTQLEVVLDSTPFKYSNLALAEEQAFPISITDYVYGSKVGAKMEDNIDLRKLQVDPDEDFAPNSTLTLVLYTITEKLAHLDYVPHGNINRTIWQPQAPALLGTDREQWNEHQFVAKIPYQADDPIWITLIVNNLDEEAHAFHLHGHDFYVLSTYSSTYNWGSYNPFDGSRPPGGEYSSKPLKKDTVSIPRRGYAVLQFRADNPGIWMFHCHVMWHMASGMAMAFEVG